MKKKLEPVNYSLTKTESHYHIATIQLIKKLVDQTRESNVLLRQLLAGENRQQIYHSTSIPIHISEIKKRTSLAHASRTPEKAIKQIPSGSWTSRYQEGTGTIERQEELIPREIEHGRELERAPKDIEALNLQKVMESFHNEVKEISDVNRQLFSRLLQLEENRSRNIPEASNQYNQLKNNSVENILIKLSNDKERKKSSINYGILSEIMPFSDKREIKVKFTIQDLLNRQLSSNLNLTDLKQKVTEWVGIVYRATASVCWNLLYSGSLNFQEVKVLFTENIIYNFIQFINEIEKYIDEEGRFQITNHINWVSCNVLEFLCRQYPQTKIEAPNMALKKAIPTIENQDQVKYDIISMVLRDCGDLPNEVAKITFGLREDKDYCSEVMKTINYMIDKTEQQFEQFQTIMSNIFEQIYLPKQKRTIENINKPHTGNSSEAQYRQKVKTYSSYLIGRKIPKNTPKYTDLQIQYGVFFVKAPSILRIITKWVEQLYDFVSKAHDQEKCASIELKNHKGKAINMSSRVKNLLFQKIYQQLDTIKKKIDRIKKQCYFMEFFLSGVNYVNDEKQVHLSEDQLRVGKFCSNLKNAISSYVCSQLSKLIYYTSLVPQAIKEIDLNFNDEDFKEQARKHLDSVNLVSLKIFDLLRCKCHSNEEEIIWVVQALKKLEQVDQKFQIVRVKDRLSQGTRDIMINAQYDGGLVWEIQLAVTSNVDKKQDMLDKYNHFLYELKRAKLGPLSECVSIWSSLEQRSIYFEQLNLKRKIKRQQIKIKHKDDCEPKEGEQDIFTEFKRPIICYACKQYFSIPTTSLLNVRCEACKITYCGMCFYESKSNQDKEEFMFQNFWRKPILTKRAFEDLQQYSSLKDPFPLQGFFIKKKFLNRQLSYFTLVQMSSPDKTQSGSTNVNICIAQTVLRGKSIICRTIHNKYINAQKKNDQQYYLNQEHFKEFENFWIFYFPKKKPERITLQTLKDQMQKPANFGVKYLNVLAEPNYMREISLAKKSFEKIRLINSLEQGESTGDLQIGVYRFKNLVVLSRFIFKDEQRLRQTLVIKNNQNLLKKYAEKKKEVVHLENKQLTNQFQLLTIITEFPLYLQKIKKLYLNDNQISTLSFLGKCKTLTLLSISKNKLRSLEGLQPLKSLTFLTFDQNQVESLKNIDGLLSLTYLSGNKNRLTAVQGVKNLIKLDSLSLCDNQISTIEELTCLSGLRRVYLRNNHILDIGALSSLSNLRHFFIGDNKVNPELIRNFKCLGTLEEMSLKNTNLKAIPNIFSSMTHLSELKLNNNQIKKIEHIEKLQNLKRLDLSNNLVEVISNLEKLLQLEQLNLKKNQIKVVPGLGRLMESLKKIILCQGESGWCFNIVIKENPLKDVSEYLKFEDKTTELMRLKYSKDKISAQATEQIRRHNQEINNKSDGDD